MSDFLATIFSNRMRRWVIYASFITPLIVLSSQSIFPFVFPKAIFFEVVVFLLAIFSVPALVAGAARPFLRGAYFWFAGAYIVALLLSAFSAFDVNRALWSNFERMTGAVFIIHALVFSVLVGLYFYEARISAIEKALSVFLWVSIPVSLSGLIQVIDPSFLNSASNRVAGVFGNPIYMGGFAAESLLITGWFIYKYWRTKMRGVYIGIGVIHLLALYFSGTRSALLALIVGLCGIGIIYLPRFWKRGYATRIKQIGGVFIFLAAALFVADHFGALGQASMVNRLLDISSSSGTASTRFIAWEIAFKGFKERPVFGWGPENYFYVFNKFFNPQSQLFGSYETWFDHAHDAPIEALVTQGAVGFSLYLLQYILLIWMGIQLCRAYQSDELSEFRASIYVAFFVVHFIHNLFVFDHPSSYAMFYFMAGLVFAEYARLKESGDVKKASVPSPVLVFMLQALLFLAMLWMVVPSVRQNSADLDAQMAINGQDYSGAEVSFDSAFALKGPHTADVLLDVGRTMQSMSTQDLQAHQDYYAYGIKSLDTLLANYEPANVLAALLEAQIMSNYAPIGGATTVQQADARFALAVRFSPNRQQIYYSWARLKMTVKDTATAIQLMDHAVKLEPDVPFSHWIFATMLIGVDKQRAASELATALELGQTLDSSAAVQAAIMIYSDAGQYGSAVRLYKLAVTQKYISDPRDPAIGLFDTTAAKANDSATRYWIRQQFPAANLPAIK